MSISIGPALHPALYISELKTRKRDSALHEMARRAQAQGVACDPELLHALLALRERLGGTAMGHSIAVTDARSLTVIESRLLVGRSRRGVDWGAADGEPVRLVLLALSTAETPAASHLERVARAVAAVRPARARQRLLETESLEELGGLLREVLT